MNEHEALRAQLEAAAPEERHAMLKRWAEERARRRWEAEGYSPAAIEAMTANARHYAEFGEKIYASVEDADAAEDTTERDAQIRRNIAAAHLAAGFVPTPERGGYFLSDRQFARVRRAARGCRIIRPRARAHNSRRRATRASGSRSRAPSRLGDDPEPADGRRLFFVALFAFVVECVLLRAGVL